MEILSVEFAQAVILRAKELKRNDKHIMGMNRDPNYETKIKQMATDDVFKQFVEEEKLNLLPKPLLNSAWLKQIKTGREYPKFGYAQSKTLIKIDESMAIGKKLDRGGAYSNQQQKKGKTLEEINAFVTNCSQAMFRDQIAMTTSKIRFN